MPTTAPPAFPPTPPTQPPEEEPAARYMVLVDGRAACAARIRETCILAGRRGAPWLAVYLDVSRRLLYSQMEERRLSENLRLVERLGGDLACCAQASPKLSQDLLSLARLRGATHLVLGPGRWLDRYRGALLEELSGEGLELIVHLVPNRPGLAQPLPPSLTTGFPGWRQLAWAMALLVAATAMGYLMYPTLGLADVMMAYMLAITIAATRLDRWATLLTSVLSILALDFCFIKPRYTFVLTDIQHIGTFAVMLGVGWVILNLAENIRLKSLLAQDRERHTRTLYRVGSMLAEGGSQQAIRDRVEVFLGRELEMPVTILLCGPEGQLERVLDVDPALLAAARTALASGAPWGPESGSAAHSPWLVLPLPGTERPLGVLALLPPAGAALPEKDRLDQLPPVAAQIALALERARLSEERTEARIRADHEELRSSLLSSVSHDLRSPLGTITGATTTLLDPGPDAAPGDQKVLLNTIHQESRRLLRMVNNLLDITKLESGQMRVKKEWAAMEEVLGSAIGHLEEQLEGRALNVDLPETWVPMDPVLFQQALLNILDNALKYSPAGSPVDISGWVRDGDFHLQVADRGPGIKAGEEELIFQKLYRGAGAVAPGAGLGLAIGKGIVQAHGGTLQARNRAGGGAEFSITLPLAAPALEAMPPEPRNEP